MSNVDTFDSQEIDQALSRFEASVDVSDPVQLAMLEEMREHTRRLHQVRGDWNKPSNFRNWNDTKPQTEVKPPLAIESYREYKQYVRKENESLQALITNGGEDGGDCQQQQTATPN